MGDESHDSAKSAHQYAQVEGRSHSNHAKCRENCLPYFAKILENIRISQPEKPQAKGSCIVQRRDHIKPHVCRT